MNTLLKLKQWVKTQDHPLARFIKQIHKAIYAFEIPAFTVLYLPLRLLHGGLNQLISNFARVLYWTPMFKTRLRKNPSRCAKRLNLFGTMPQVLGSLEIEVGNDCRISGQTTFSGRWSSVETPQLIIGDNVGISWQTTIAVGTKVILKDNVRMGGRVFLAGYPGHPLDPSARAKGLPDMDDQVGDIILEEDVWLGSGVTVMRGVTIGRGTIVATGSIVTRNLPSNVIAAGNPAKVLRKLDLKSTEQVADFHSHAVRIKEHKAQSKLTPSKSSSASNNNNRNSQEDSHEC
jgi:acetyltransferase-like isoleucine patch superfamily enzyme